MSITLTFGEDFQNSIGYNIEYFEQLKTVFPMTEIYGLHQSGENLNVELPKAWISIVRNPFSDFEQNVLFQQIANPSFLTIQEKKTSNKKLSKLKTRTTVGFNDGQLSDLEGVISIQSFNCRNFPHLINLYSRIILYSLFTENLNVQTIEANYYPNIERTCIRNLSSLSRKKIITYILGQSITITFQWYCRAIPITPKMTFILNSGDLLIMDEKSLGIDGKRSVDLTLRHFIGSAN